MIGIYKITSPSKKVYIGQSVNIEKRKYFYEIGNCKKQIKLYNSIKKYGLNCMLTKSSDKSGNMSLETAASHNLNKGTLSSRLSGIMVNNTNFIYV
jgi:hypothetical protein